MTSPSWDAAYTASAPAPWDIGRPQPAFLRLASSGLLAGQVLDAGCGTGEHALLAARFGAEVVGVDVSARAIEQARAKAAARGIGARFAVADALSLADLGLTFDTIIDSGLFHVFDDEDRAPFVAGLAAATRRGGHYFMLCFSDDEPPGWGPRRITQDEIRNAFRDGWRVETIEPADLDVTLREEPVRSWLASITRA